MRYQDNRQFEYDCRDTQELLALLVVCPEELTVDERSGACRHLAGCSACRADFEGMKLAGEMLLAGRDHLRSKEAAMSDNLGYLGHEEAMELRFQARLERSGIRRKRRERKEKMAKVRKIVRPIAAVAACLVVACILYQTVAVRYAPVPEVAVKSPDDSVKIELLTDQGLELLSTGMPIVASGEPKTLRINSNRQMVLNIGTKLSIEPYNLGCIVKLDQGEIYTEVEHDGKPFVVETSYGRAVITGTTFNIKADDNKMDLAVIEGSVQFESERGTVNVEGGYQSSITGYMKPTKPVACDVIQIGKWAKRHDIESSPRDIPVNTDISELSKLPLVYMSYCDLEDVDFDVWIEQRREWFEREFPWTKRLQRLLAQNGIEVDVIDLLVESGDLCRFAWPEYSRDRILVEDAEIILGIASRYGVEVNELVSREALVQTEHSSNIEACGRWLSAFDKNEGVTIDSIHAVVFLANTRSLTWFAIKNCKVQVQDKNQILDLLLEQVKTASDSLEILNQLILADTNKSVCSTSQYDEYIRNLKDDISAMIEIEKELAEHEVISK